MTRDRVSAQQWGHRRLSPVRGASAFLSAGIPGKTGDRSDRGQPGRDRRGRGLDRARVPDHMVDQVARHGRVDIDPGVSGGNGPGENGTWQSRSGPVSISHTRQPPTSPAPQTPGLPGEERPPVGRHRHSRRQRPVSRLGRAIRPAGRRDVPLFTRGANPVMFSGDATWRARPPPRSRDFPPAAIRARRPAPARTDPGQTPRPRDWRGGPRQRPRQAAPGVDADTPRRTGRLSGSQDET